MSAMDLAPRKASTKRSDLRFSEPNSSSFVISRVHEKTEASSRPSITTFTTALASMNIVIGVILPSFFGAVAAGASGSGAGAAAAITDCP